MRKFLISATLLASTVAIAAPAAAQWAPSAPQGYAYGYNNHGQVRRLDARIDNLQRQIQQLDRRNILSNSEARRLTNESRELERRLRRIGSNGLNSRERYAIESGIARLEQRIRREATDGNRRLGNNSYGYNQYDRDRDGRDDRYEDDRGRRHD